MNQLTHSFKGTKLIIHDCNKIARFNYPIKQYSCPCGKQFCLHIEYLFSTIIGVDPLNIRLLTVHPISGWIRDRKYGELKNGQLDEYINQFLIENHCDICLDSLAEGCHHKCHAKWKGNCPRCNR
jgi:hypothetical protein